MASETLADIIAEKRNRADEIERDVAEKMKRGEMISDQYAREVVADLHKEADRIEAAWKRSRAEVGADALSAGGLVEAMRHKPGNAAALREALSDACYAMFNFLKTQSGGFEEMANALDKAKTALAKPPRNCDVGDVADWEKRFGEECDKGHTCSDCPVRHAKTKMAIELDKGARCEFIWVQMPYKEGSAK